jgi:hypothetical protein
MVRVLQRGRLELAVRDVKGVGEDVGRGEDGGLQ